MNYAIEQTAKLNIKKAFCADCYERIAKHVSNTFNSPDNCVNPIVD